MSLNLNVTRNEVNSTLVEGKFGKKSQNFGKTFYTPVIEPPILSEVTTQDGQVVQVLTNIKGLVWYGLKEAAEHLTKYARSVYMDIYLDNVDKTTGLVNEEKMQQDWANPWAGMEKLKDIEAQLEIYYDEQQNIIAEEDFGGTNEQATALDNRMKELAALIRPLKISKAALQAEYADRVAKRAERKAQEEAATKDAAATK
jgi:hypothetical protein